MPNQFWQSFLIVFSLALLITYFTYDDTKMLDKLYPKHFKKADLILSGERSECTKTYMRTRTHEKIKNGFLKGEE